MLAGALVLLGLYGLILLAILHRLQPGLADPGAAYPFVNVLLAWGLAVALILPHELSHAAAAWLAGGKVFEIRVGIGPPVLQKTIRDVTFTLGRVWLSGQCVAAFPMRDRLRLRVLVLVAAGMLFSLALLLLLAPTIDPARFFTRFSLLESLALAAASHLVFGLLPVRSRQGAQQVGSDGYQLWELLSGKMSEALMHLSYYSTAGFYALRRGAYSQAVETCEAGLALYPTSTCVRNIRAVVLLEMDRHAEALCEFKAVLAHLQAPDFSPEPGLTAEQRSYLRAILLNNVAYAILLRGPDRKLAEQAYDQARRAFRMVPWEPSIQGTLGAALVEVGCLREGIEHLLAAADHHDTPRGKASNLAYAALGCWGLGDAARSAALLRQAVTLDSTPYVVRKAQAELSPGR